MQNIEKKIGATVLRVGLPAGGDPNAQRMGVSFDLPDGSSRSHVFNNFGSGDWRDFLCSLDRGYVGDKFFGSATRQPSLAETMKNISLDIRERLEEAMFSSGTEAKDEARELARSFRKIMEETRAEFRGSGNGIGSPEETIEIQNLVSSYARASGIDSPGSLVGHRENPQFSAFMRRVWEPTMTELRAERETEMRQEENAAMPEI